MKQRIFLLVLAVLMLMVFTACVGPQTQDTTDPQETTEPVVETTGEPTLPPLVAEEPTLKGNVYQITEPNHLLYMAEHPDKDYALAEDIDMRGSVWTPVDDFTGSLKGLIASTFNYTISNLVIEAKEGDTNVGFFRIVSGTVEDVNFENITLVCPGTFSGNVGIVAGVCKTALNDVAVKNCSVEATVRDANAGLLCGKQEKDAITCDTQGSMKLTLAGGTSYVGGAFGYSEGSVLNCEIRTDITAEGAGTAGAAGGIAGYAKGVVRSGNYIAHLKVSGDATFAAGSLVGHLAGGGLSTSYNCARSFEVTGAVCANDYCGIQETGVAVSGCLKRDNANIEDTLSAAELALRQKVVDYAYQMATYRWYPSKTIKYTDACSGGRHAQTYEAGKVYFGMPYAHKNSSFAKFLSNLDENRVTVDSLTADITGLQQLGNDCADLVYWAWSQVEADLKYTLTNDAICVNGVLPVGDYNVNSIVATSDICSHNGKQVMYEAYAKLQMGDAVLYAPGGHMRLVAEAAYVFRNADGSIDPNKSYIVTHEQGAGCTNLDSTRTTCKVNGKYTFSTLFSGDYIPVTMEAYAKGEADVLTATISNKKLDKSGVGSGIITANYRPDKVTLRIEDSKGNTVLELVNFPSDGTAKTTAALSVFRSAVKAKLAELEAGKEYNYEVMLAAGGQEICVQTFKFTA